MKRVAFGFRRFANYRIRRKLSPDYRSRSVKHLPGPHTDPLTALRRPTQLGAARHRHAEFPVKSEAPEVGHDLWLCRKALVEVMGLWADTTSSMRPKRCHVRRPAVTWAYGRRAVALPGSRALHVP